MLKSLRLVLLILVGPVFSLSAQSNIVGSSESSLPADTARVKEMPQIEVIGTANNLARIPGAAFVVSQKLIGFTTPVSGNEALRKVSGVHVVDEEGAGLRANIGIRGLDPDRSRTVLMLEDGIPIALAPYGEPEMYYTPAIDRMTGIEIIKGSGSILFGPQTFGGVINYITANPPPVETLSTQFRSGNNGFLLGKVSYGNTIGNTGFSISALQKQGDRIGITHFGLTDLSAKVRVTTSDKSVFGFKLGFYNESSNATYVGLTQRMYDAGELDFSHPAPDDQLHIRRYSASLSHHYFFNAKTSLKTTAFAYATVRNWSRQDFRTAPRANETYVRVFGDQAQPSGALYFLDRTGNRNRHFEVAGVEPRLSTSFQTGSLQHDVDMGFRVLHERAFEQRINGTFARPTSGTLVDDEIRTGKAASIFVQNRISFQSKLSVTPGVRVESFWYERDILRLGSAQSAVTTNDRVLAIIPGIGAAYQWNAQSTLFAGVHRGFGPPRVKDAITVTGASENLDAELSWNSEIGFRWGSESGIQAEIALFNLHFQNQIIPVSESSGGSGTSNATGLVNGGETRHRGVEMALSGDFGQLFDRKFSLVGRINATFTNAFYASDRFIQNGNETVNINGNALPYAPRTTAGGSLNLILPSGFEAGINATYVHKQFGDELNLTEGSSDGLTGLIPAYAVVDAQVGYSFSKWKGVKFLVSAKNLTNERYMVSRRPQGIRLGIDRFITAGLEVKL